MGNHPIKPCEPNIKCKCMAEFTARSEAEAIRSCSACGEATCIECAKTCWSCAALLCPACQIETREGAACAQCAADMMADATKFREPCACGSTDCPACMWVPSEDLMRRVQRLIGRNCPVHPEAQPPEPKGCDNCGSTEGEVIAYDFGVCQQTGYHDAGERCSRCAEPTPEPVAFVQEVPDGDVEF